MNVIQVPGIPDCTTVNVVGTCNLGVGLNLLMLAQERRWELPVKFNPDKFAAITFNFESSGITQMTALIFSTGNVVLTGAVSEEQSRDAAWDLALYFNWLGIPARVCHFKIRNMVSSLRLGFEVDLYALQEGLGDRVCYEPWKFPAAVVRSTFDEKEVTLVYISGGVVLTGCKCRWNIRRNHISIYHTASLYKAHAKKSNYEKHDYRLRGLRKSADSVGFRKLNKLLSKGTKKADTRGDMLYKMMLNPRAPHLRSLPFRPPQLALTAPTVPL